MKKKKQKEKINPIMGNSSKNSKKLKKLKNNRIVNNSEDENEVKSFIIIVVIIAVLVGAIYFATELFKKEDKTANEVKSGEINYDKLTLGMLLNRPYEEYYVIIYDSKDSKAIQYQNAVSKYSSREKSLKVYYCDLSNKLNSQYYNVGNDNKSNPNAKKISELDLGDVTLIKVKNHEITKYVEGIESINSTLNKA